MFSKFVILVLCLTLLVLGGYLIYSRVTGKVTTQKTTKVQNLSSPAMDTVPIGQPFNRALLTLTFDDGFDTQFTKAQPLLAKNNFSATFYISTGLLGKPGYMSDEMVGKLKALGFHIADHTVSHPELPKLPLVDAERELAESKKYLQTKFGVSAEDFASPYGEINEQVLVLVKKYFKTHRGVLSGYNYKDTLDIYNIKVQNVKVSTSIAEVESWIRSAQTNKSWLILVYHQIDDRGDTYSATPISFEDQISAIAKSKIDVVSLDNAIGELLPQIGK